MNAAHPDLGSLSVLPPELITAIAAANAAGCSRLWKYLTPPQRRHIAVISRLDGWIDSLAVHSRDESCHIGATITTLFGKLHSFSDAPAKVWDNNSTEWWCVGRLYSPHGRPALNLMDLKVINRQGVEGIWTEWEIVHPRHQVRVWADHGKASRGWQSGPTRDLSFNVSEYEEFIHEGFGFFVRRRGTICSMMT